MALASLLAEVLATDGNDLPVAFALYDGSRLGPDDAPTTVVLRSRDALRRIVQAPGELGFARAYVVGDIDVDGDVYAALSLRDRLSDLRLRPRQFAAAVRLAGPGGLVRRLPPPPEEARLSGRRHSKDRDAAAIAHHYDV